MDSIKQRSFVVEINPLKTKQRYVAKKQTFERRKEKTCFYGRQSKLKCPERVGEEISVLFAFKQLTSLYCICV